MFGILTLTLGIIFAILGFIANQLRKSRMRRALGRDVKASDATSIASWIEVVENEDKKRP